MGFLQGLNECEKMYTVTCQANISYNDSKFQLILWFKISRENQINETSPESSKLHLSSTFKFDLPRTSILYGNLFNYNQANIENIIASTTRYFSMCETLHFGYIFLFYLQNIPGRKIQFKGFRRLWIIKIKYRHWLKKYKSLWMKTKFSKERYLSKFLIIRGWCLLLTLYKLIPIFNTKILIMNEWFWK